MGDSSWHHQAQGRSEVVRSLLASVLEGKASSVDSLVDLVQLQRCYCQPIPEEATVVETMQV